MEDGKLTLSSEEDKDLLHFLDNLDNPNIFEDSVEEESVTNSNPSTLKPEDEEDFKIVKYLANFDNKDSTLVRKVDSMLGDGKSSIGTSDINFNPFKKGGGKGLLSMQNLNIKGKKKKRKKKKQKATVDFMSPTGSLEKMAFESNQFFEGKISNLEEKVGEYEKKLKISEEKNKERDKLVEEMKIMKLKLAQSEKSLIKKSTELKKAKLGGGKKKSFFGICM